VLLECGELLRNLRPTSDGPGPPAPELFRFRTKPPFPLHLEHFHTVEKCKNSSRTVSTLSNSHSGWNACGSLGRGAAGGQTWVRFGSNDIRIPSKTRVQDADPT